MNHTLLAQMGGGGANPNAGILAGILGAMCLFLVVLLVVVIFYLLTLSKCLSRCRRRNRTMEPGQVWLNLIPLFNIYWQFITVLRMSESLENEFRDRGRHRSGNDYGKVLGLSICVIGLVNGVFSQGAQMTNTPILSIISLLVSLASLVMFIIYWVKIAGYSREIASRRGGREDENVDDDLDDAPPRKKRPAADDDFDDDR